MKIRTFCAVVGLVVSSANSASAGSSPPYTPMFEKQSTTYDSAFNVVMDILEEYEQGRYEWLPHQEVTVWVVNEDTEYYPCCVYPEWNRYFVSYCQEATGDTFDVTMWFAAGVDVIGPVTLTRQGCRAGLTFDRLRPIINWNSVTCDSPPDFSLITGAETSAYFPDTSAGLWAYGLQQDGALIDLQVW